MKELDFLLLRYLRAMGHGASDERAAFAAFLELPDPDLVRYLIAGDVPDYVDALDGLGWINAVVDYSSGSSPRRQAQLERLASWASPTWDAHFRRFTRFMEELDEPAA